MEFDNTSRVLVVAPHPDDESLACGALIQTALRGGAAVRVILVTDGDNNPWPQRWIERRWRIDALARKRWGERRRVEAQAALLQLGVDLSQVSFLGWPDQGLTTTLIENKASQSLWMDEIETWMPSHIVLPALEDRHPDHSACRVMLEVALAKQERRPTLLEYLVHGRANEHGQTVSVALDSHMLQRKQAAVLMHRSQITLSRKRLMAHVRSSEYFQQSAFAERDVYLQETILPWRIGPFHAPWMDVTLIHKQGSVRAPLRKVARLYANNQWNLRTEMLNLKSPVFAKLQLRIRSPWIFDYWGWRRLG